jgi:hypothetical protein
MVDTVGWGKALEDTQRGLTNALEKIGHAGAPETHPAAQEILAFIGSSAPKGSKLRERVHERALRLVAGRRRCPARRTLLHVGQLRIVNASGAPWPADKFNRKRCHGEQLSPANPHRYPMMKSALLPVW